MAVKSHCSRCWLTSEFLPPSPPLEQLLEENSSKEYTRQVVEAALGVKGLAEQLAGLLDILAPVVPPAEPSQ